jgi:hypothetical protein
MRIIKSRVISGYPRVNLTGPWHMREFSGSSCWAARRLCLPAALLYGVLGELSKEIVENQEASGSLDKHTLP